MTPERAAYHYLMLTQGLREAFDREFDEALETEDPLSDLTVKLCAAPPSDTEACWPILMNYYSAFNVDGDEIFRLVLADVADRWRSGSLTPKDLVDLCHDLAEEADTRWCLDLDEFRSPYYCWDHAQQGEITWERFRECMEEFFTTGSCPHP